MTKEDVQGTIDAAFRIMRNNPRDRAIRIERQVLGNLLTILDGIGHESMGWHKELQKERRETHRLQEECSRYRSALEEAGIELTEVVNEDSTPNQPTP